MESSKYIEDLASIKTMMNKSSRFMSLSGLSGILAGCYALIAFFVANRFIAREAQANNAIPRLEYFNPEQGSSSTGLLTSVTTDLGRQLVLIGLITLIAAVVTGIILTVRKAKKQNEKIWDATSRRLAINLAIPLATGGLFCMVLLQYDIIGLIAPATLIFYGLALINASKFTLGDIKYLGIANVTIGLISTQFIGFGLYFWAIGFGILHIVYGSVMYFKYDRNSQMIT